MGMILVDNSFATLIREQDIVINPSDMNVILSTIQSHPAVKKITTLLPLCLPGVSDEGYLYLTIKYSTPSIGIIYASLLRESFPECMKAANEVDSIIERDELHKSIKKHMEKYYTKPYAKGKLNKVKEVEIDGVAIVKDKYFSQITTFGMPIIANNKEDKANIRELEKVYYKTLDPRRVGETFEYMEKSEEGIIYAETDERFTMAIKMKSNTSEIDAINAKEKIKRLIIYDPEQYFIGDYK